MSKHLLLAIVILAAGVTVSACSHDMGGGASQQSHVPSTGSAAGVTVPNARPGMQSMPMGASTAGSSLSR